MEILKLQATKKWSEAVDELILVHDFFDVCFKVQQVLKSHINARADSVFDSRKKFKHLLDDLVSGSKDIVWIRILLRFVGAFEQINIFFVGILALFYALMDFANRQEICEEHHYIFHENRPVFNQEVVIIDVNVVLYVLVIDIRIRDIRLELTCARSHVHRMLWLIVLKIKSVNSHTRTSPVHLLFIKLLVLFDDSQHSLEDGVDAFFKLVPIENL